MKKHPNKKHTLSTGYYPFKNRKARTIAIVKRNTIKNDYSKMKKQWIIACLAGVLTTGAQAQQSNYVSEVWIADQGNGTYKNPVLYADYSDPDVCRVGDDFYLTSSSFGCLPGLQILHSKDLVNWSIISAAVPAALPPVTTPDVRNTATVCGLPVSAIITANSIFSGETRDQGIFMGKVVRGRRSVEQARTCKRD